jgi:hypothetical protein
MRKTSKIKMRFFLLFDARSTSPPSGNFRMAKFALLESLSNYLAMLQLAQPQSSPIFALINFCLQHRRFFSFVQKLPNFLVKEGLKVARIDVAQGKIASYVDLQSRTRHHGRSVEMNPPAPRSRLRCKRD